MLDLIRGDAWKVLPTRKAESVDAVVTDAPYDLTSVSRKGSSRVPGSGPFGRHRIGTKRRGFMGKDWDGTGIAFDPAFWMEVLRVMKPGAHLLCFGGTRTYHRLTCAIEDAGFEVRDCLMWIYGSGFPKSLDVSKAIDKRAGATRRIIGRRTDRAASPKMDIRGGRLLGEGRPQIDLSAITAPATLAAQQWQGWGTALKPAYEPIILARKPLIDTVAGNILHHSTGGLNIDACRVPCEPVEVRIQGSAPRTSGRTYGAGALGSTAPRNVEHNAAGRWPANVIHDGSDEVLRLFPEAAGASNKRPVENADGDGDRIAGGKGYGRMTRDVAYRDTGSAARFFYCAKASRSERGQGNNHPTVKPLALCRYLCRLITPPGGTILDCFLGSGSIGKAAKLEGFHFIGIEREAEYMRIAKRRLA